MVNGHLYLLQTGRKNMQVYFYFIIVMKRAEKLSTYCRYTGQNRDFQLFSRTFSYPFIGSTKAHIFRIIENFQ